MALQYPLSVRVATATARNLVPNNGCASWWSQYTLIGEIIFLNSLPSQTIPHPKHASELFLVGKAGIPYLTAFTPQHLYTVILKNHCGIK